MGPVHGIANTASVQVCLRELITNPYFKWPVSIAAGLITFVGTTIGVHLSEVEEAKAELDKMMCQV